MWKAYTTDQIYHWGLETAKQIMDQLYGNSHSESHRVITAYCKEIKQCLLIKPSDAEACKKFHNFLFKCGNITEMQTWNFLDIPEIICMPLFKLAGGTRDKWSRRVVGN